MASNGELIDALNPDPSQIDIPTIAHHLSMQCRFNGACREFYSTAEHSATGAAIALREYDDHELALAFLLHDAHEAFIGDIVSPMKPFLTDSPWWHAADALDLAIQERFDVSFDDERIGVIDRHMLAVEWRYLMPDPHRYDEHLIDGVRVDLPFCNDPLHAKQWFIHTAEFLDVI